MTILRRWYEGQKKIFSKNHRFFVVVTLRLMLHRTDDISASKARLFLFLSLGYSHAEGWSNSTVGQPGAGIMEADDRQVTTVFTVQPSFHHRHSTNRVS